MNVPCILIVRIDLGAILYSPTVAKMSHNVVHGNLSKLNVVWLTGIPVSWVIVWGLFLIKISLWHLIIFINFFGTTVTCNIRSITSISVSLPGVTWYFVKDYILELYCSLHENAVLRHLCRLIFRLLWQKFPCKSAILSLAQLITHTFILPA